jgi:hypothetical protein
MRQIKMSKQYMIVRVIRDIGSGVSELIPYLGGVLTLESAEQVIAKAVIQDPSSTFMIQEVGTA